MLGQTQPLPVPFPCAKSTLQSMLGYYGRHRPRKFLFYFTFDFISILEWFCFAFTFTLTLTLNLFIFFFLLNWLSSIFLLNFILDFFLFSFTLRKNPMAAIGHHTTSTTNAVCGLCFSRSQPDLEGFLRALRFPPFSRSIHLAVVLCSEVIHGSCSGAERLAGCTAPSIRPR